MKARGRKIEKQFSKEVLIEIVTSIRERTRIVTSIRERIGRNPDQKNIANKIKVWRGRYAEVKHLLNMFGFGWDDVTKMVTAGEEQWNGLKTTKFYKYKNISVKNYRELAQLVSDDVADGSLAMSGGERSEAERIEEELTHRNASHGGVDNIEEGNISQTDVGASQHSVRNKGSRKRRSSDSEEIKKTLSDIASAVYALVERIPESSISLFNRVYTSVLSLPYIPEDLKFDVVDFLCANEKLASRFLAISDIEMKRRWLERHFHMSYSNDNH